MRSSKPGGREPFRGVLDADGAIDLSGEGHAVPAKEASRRRSRDAWLVDRERRSLMPRPIDGGDAFDDEVGEHIDLRREIADRFALGDFAGVLHAAELLLGEDSNDESALRYASASRERMEVRYTTRIGSLDYVFNRAVAESKVKWLGLDPQAAFLLSLTDGQTTVAEVLELSGMRRLEALRVFTELLEAKAIERVA